VALDDNAACCDLIVGGRVLDNEPSFLDRLLGAMSRLREVDIQRSKRISVMYDKVGENSYHGKAIPAN
jgi:hypothetical protein